MKQEQDKKALSEDEAIGSGDAYESQLDENDFVDEDGNRFHKNDDGIWCRLVMSKFCSDEI